MMGWHGLNLFGLGEGPVVAYCVKGNEPSCARKSGKFLC